MNPNKRHLFIIVFLLLAFLVTYFTFQKIPHSLVLHINSHWHIMLVGESRPGHVEYHGTDFVTHEQNTGNLRLSGNGTIIWRQHKIRIDRNNLIINNRIIQSEHPQQQLHLMLYPDGRISKGKFTAGN